MGKLKIIPGIYCITNLLNNKKYVGHSKSIYKRWNNHKYNLRRNKDNCSHLQRAWNKYGGDNFDLSILEVLPSHLTKQEFEGVETKWVLFFNSHLSEYGYNGVLPGTIPLRRKEENITRVGGNKKVSIICINTLTGDIVEKGSAIEASQLTGIRLNRVNEYCNYWINKNKRRRIYKGWIVVYKRDYVEGFDYNNYFQERKPIEKKIKEKVSYKKNPEDIIPYEERKLKRCPIVAVNILSGEEILYNSIKDTSKDFCECKVVKCINSPFMKYKHRGFYFKRYDMGG